MSIVRLAQRKKQWHSTDQRVLDDHRLSWEALGLHVYLCSRPDNWSVNVSYLGKTLMRLGRRAGRDKIYGLLRELTSFGYADEKVEREGGKYKNHEWIIYDFPKGGFPPREREQEVSDLPDTAPPESAEPNPVKPILLNTDSSTNTDSDSRTESKSRARSARKNAPTKSAGGSEQQAAELETDPVLASVVGNLVEAVRFGSPVRDLRALVVAALRERDLPVGGTLISQIIAAVRSRAPVRRKTNNQQETSA